MDEATASRFWAKVDRRGTDECWPWMAAIVDGYGVFKLAGRQRKAHRITFESMVGPVPDGMQLDHLCRNRACCNPAHLEPVTCRDNLLRGDTHAARNASKTHCHRGHPFDDDNTYHRGGRRICRACRRLTDEARAALRTRPPRRRSCAT